MNLVALVRTSMKLIGENAKFKITKKSNVESRGTTENFSIQCHRGLNNILGKV